MTKELIISANVHEKKVAILEDGVVTEFYVERRDENQGVVGNLYKGRVMKVLPGMQSAFVDIGLERDAFLYVSDFTEFMEDEDEIDFKDMAEKPRADVKPSRIDERPRRNEPVRRETPAAAPQRAISRGDDGAADLPVPFDDVVEQLAEIADESLIPPPPPDEDSGELNIAQREEALEVSEANVALVEEIIGERITDDPVEWIPEPPVIPATPAFEKISDDDIPARVEAEPAAVEAVTEPEGVDEKPKRGRSRKKTEEATTRKTAGRAAKKTAKAKDGKAEAAPAESSKRKGSTKSATRRGSRKRAGEAEAEEGEAASASEFERVTDEDVAQDPGDLLKDAIIQEKIIEQIHTAEYQTSPFQPEPEPEWRVGSLRSRMAAGSDFQRVMDEAAETPAQDAVESRGIVTGAGESGAAPEDADSEFSTSPFRHIAQAIPPGIYDRAFAEAEDSGEINDIGGLAATGEEAGATSAEDFGSTAETDDSGERSEETLEGDAEAAVRDRRGTAEFAVRRGGRGRRRRREPQPGAATAVAEEPKASATPVVEEAEAEVAEVETANDVSRAVPPRHQDPRRDRRPEPQRRPDQAPMRRPERMPATTISELLHEGQEILVQIAKEPIAKKGARITSHIALPGRYLVYMPTVNHVGVSRKIASEVERVRLKRLVGALREREAAQGGFIARTACAGHTEQELHDDMRYLLRTWAEVRKKADRLKAPALVHRDLDLVQRILRDQLSEEFSAIRVDSETEFARIVEFVNRVQPKLVKRVKLHIGDQPILEKHAVQPEIDKAVRPRVWLKSGGYIVINQTEALVAIDVNTGKFVGKSDKLEDTITRTNLEAAKEIVRQIRLRDLGGIIVIDFIDMEERKNRQRVMLALQQELQSDRAPSKILSINDFGLVAITRKRVKQSLERTLCTPCPYCQGAGMVKSPQTMCFEILAQAKAISKQISGSSDVMLRVSQDIAEAFRTTEREVLEEIEAYLGTPVTIEADPTLHQEQYDFAIF